ncbi:copper resistance CopC family protein [Nocardioides furvisabuli]|uniref:copper resistance CopC family protein n=1 Tax=Nocardioides furvisabuli TaxID=375542 RepID=UPI0022ABC7BB|nr:copper resistance CopC family protein [Nocardioides furvisabuli]
MSPANAHTELVDSVPSDGAVLDEVPREVRLQFSEEIEARLSTVNLRASDGAIVTLELRGGAAPSTLVALLPSSLRPNARSATRWRTTFRVVSADGHPVVGAVDFVVRAGGGLPSEDPQPKDPGRGATTSDVETDATATPARDRGESWPLAVLGGGVLVLLALSVWTIMRLARRNPAE